MPAKFQEQRCKTDGGALLFHREKPSRLIGKITVSEKPVKLPEGMALLGPCFEWSNDLYLGTIRRYEAGSPFDDGPYAVIGIFNRSNDARHDWREFQQIKNQLVGEHWEAVELYPAESRLIDPSNAFYLWCFPPGTLLSKIGHGIRRVWHPLDGGAPQRPFPEEACASRV